MVARRAAQSTSPQTTCRSSTWVVSWPSQVRWYRIRMNAAKSAWNTAVMKAA